MVFFKRTILIVFFLFFVFLVLKIGYVVGIKQKKSGQGEIYWRLVSQIKILPAKQSLKQLQGFIAKYPQSEYIEDASYNICQIKFKNCLNNKKKWGEAIEAYSTLLDDYPQSRHLEPATFFLALCYARRGQALSNSNDYVTSMDKFKQFIQLFPQSDLADEAKYNLGRVYWALRLFPQAITAYKSVINEHPGDDLIDEAYYRIAEVCFCQKNYQEAKKWLNRTLYRFSKSRIAPYAHSMLEYCGRLELEKIQKKTKKSALSKISTSSKVAPLANGWDWDLMMNEKIAKQKRNSAREYLLDAITPVNSNSGS